MQREASVEDMVRFILFTLLAVGVPLAVDYYVYRNWQAFVRHSSRPRLKRTLPFYRVLMGVMPLLLPLYFLFSEWWDVEPKLPRAFVLGLWMLYYVPKGLIALVLVVKDAARFVVWLFQWFQQRLTPDATSPSNTTSTPLDLSDMKRTSRRQFLRDAGWNAASVPFVVVGYSLFRTLYDFEVHRVDVPIQHLPRQLEGLTIAQVSDLHAGSFFSTRPMEEAVSIVRTLRPDVVTITGDYVNHDAGELSLIVPALQQLRAELGVYGCLGNHDHYARVDQVVAGLGETPIDLLINEHRTLEIDGARLHLIGTDNTGFYQNFADLPRATAGLPSDGEQVSILLAHTPTFWDSHVRLLHPDIDLMLAGHTHGGQIGLELGPVRYSLARVAYTRWAGLYHEGRPDGTGRHFLYVNRGIGTVGPPIRLGIRPEITLLTLRRA